MQTSIIKKGSPRPVLRGWLSCERRFWILASMLLGFIAVAKGLRLPNAWAATQMAINYDFGFVKRGLIGASLSAVGLSTAIYVNVTAVSLITFILALALLVSLIRVSRGHVLFGQGAAVGLAFSSFSLTYLAHLVGYADLFMLAFALTALLVNGSVSTRANWMT